MKMCSPTARIMEESQPQSYNSAKVECRRLNERNPSRICSLVFRPAGRQESKEEGSEKKERKTEERTNE